MAKEPMDGPHELRLENRARLSVNGVREVESFDEESVVLHTTKGVLVIRGQQLHLQTLSIDGGQVAVDGTVDAMSYEEARVRAACSRACCAEWSSRCCCRPGSSCCPPPSGRHSACITICCAACAAGRAG